MNYYCVPGLKRGEYWRARMGDIVSTKTEKAERIVDSVLNYFGITKAQLIGSSRKREFAYARHIVCYLLYNHTHISLKNIGIILGGRDHTTVIHGRATIKDLMSIQANVLHDVEFLSKSL